MMDKFQNMLLEADYRNSDKKKYARVFELW